MKLGNFIKICFLSANQKQESPMAAMFVDGSKRNDVTKQRTSHRCFLSNISLVGQTISENKIFSTLANQKQESHIAAMFVDGSGRNEQSL